MSTNYGNQLLQHAFKNNCNEVTTLLKRFDKQAFINYKTEVYSMGFLFMIVSNLFDTCEHVRIKSNEYTALHWAVVRQHTSIASLLIRHGCDVNARDHVRIIYINTP
jgi:ankyrin repeat protein